MTKQRIMKHTALHQKLRIRRFAALKMQQGILQAHFNHNIRFGWILLDLLAIFSAFELISSFIGFVHFTQLSAIINFSTKNWVQTNVDQLSSEQKIIEQFRCFFLQNGLNL